MLDEGRGRDDILAETGHVVGVAGADLAVRAGEICVLMGLSGSGKSTLLRAVNRLVRPARGSVTVSHAGRGIDVCACDAATLRALRSGGVAMVFQQFALLPWRSVRDNVGMGLELRGLGRRERDRIVDEKLAMVGLERWADKHAHELSGGMQQRVGLARAFATDADILLMDEPFSALDPLIRARLQDELLELQARLKKTILFVSHDLDEAAKLGNRIVIMEGGRIVQAGTVADIVLRPADRYVTDFVRHMNPLDALKADTFMVPVADLPRQGGTVLFGPGLRVTAGPDGRPATADAAGAPLRIVPLDEAAGEGDLAGALLAVPGTLPLKAAVALRRRGAAGLAVLDHDGRLMGVACEDDLFRALLRH
jgi:glycine betaine/proline transport system ATP-binding protein